MSCCCCSVTQSWMFATLCTAACLASLSLTISQSLLKVMSIELVMSSNHPVLCHPLLLLSSVFPSIRDFSNESSFCIRWPKYWSFSSSISPSSEYWGFISLKIDWFDLLASQGTFSGVFSSTTSLYALPQFIAPPYLWLSTTCQPLYIVALHKSSNCHYTLKKRLKWREVAQSCPTLCDPMDCRLPGFSVHGIFQARILEWVAISFSKRSSRPRDQSWVSRIGW